MTRNLLRAGARLRALGACALLTSTAMCTQPALAQTTTPTQRTDIPADTYAINPHGVDMRSGRYVYSHTDVTIGGGEEAGGLSLTRTNANAAGDPFGNFSHNHVMMISERRVIFGMGGSGNDYRMTVRTAGLADTFESATNHVGYTGLSGTQRTKLTWTGDRNSSSVVYTYSFADGTTAVFRPLGASGQGDCFQDARCAYVSHIVKPDGTRLDFEYAPMQFGVRLRRVVSSRGYALLLEGSDFLVTKACALNLAHAVVPANGLCPAGTPAATYGYDSSSQYPRLASVTDPANATWGFTYSAPDPNTLIMGFVKPGEAAPWLTNRLRGHSDEEGGAVQAVVHQQFASGETYTYYWDIKPVDDGTGNTLHGGFYEDAAGGETAYRYAFPIVPGTGVADSCTELPCSPDEPIGNENPGTTQYQVTPGPVEIRDPLGRTTTMEYCNQQALVSLPPTYQNRCWVEPHPVYFTDPEGIRTWPKFDAAGNIIQARRVAKPGSGLADIVTSATYNTLNPVVAAKPTSTTDANGNVTNYVWDQTHGGLLSETGPAVNGIRPQTRHEYAQRHAWVSNGAGGYVQSGQPMWVRIATSVCRTSAAITGPNGPCATPGDEVRTTYDYGPDAGPNNLQLRGTVVTADGQSVRTCTGYDQQGRAISSTGAGAQLSQCQ